MPRVASKAWIASIALVSLTLLGCPGPTFIVQQYDGPVRPRETIAILRTNASDDTKLLYLDDRDIAAPIAEDGRLHIEMLPGRHSVVVGRAGRGARSPTLEFEAEPDRVYRAVFVGPEARVYEVDRSKDALVRDVTRTSPPASPPPPPAPPPAPAPPAIDADAATPPG